MVIPEFFISFIIAVILTGLYKLMTSEDKRKATGLIWLFLVIFLATWAGGIWVRPFGPTLWGTHWMAFLLIGLLIFLLLYVTAPKKAPRGRLETLDMLERIEQENELKQFAYVTLSVSLLILLIVLIILIILRYILGVNF